MTHAAASDRTVGIAGTAFAHGALIVGVLFASAQAKPAKHVIYEVTLVAAPLPAPQVHNAPKEATPAAPEPDVPVVRRTVTKVRPAPPPPAPTHVAVDKAPVTKSTVVPVPGEAPSTGQDVVTIHQAGLQFPYPEYLKRIENAIRQRWSHQGFRPGFDAQIEFVISQDGTVPEGSINVVVSSRNSVFDDNARSAIESASNQNAFGRLPSGFVGTLPILFDFAQVAKGTP